MSVNRFFTFQRTFYKKNFFDLAYDYAKSLKYDKKKISIEAALKEEADMIKNVNDIKSKFKDHKFFVISWSSDSAVCSWMLPTENFDSFDINLYSDKYFPDKNISPKENAKKNLSDCIDLFTIYSTFVHFFQCTDGRNIAA